ncbi:unnamed protein product, partial [Mesorhabditis belari]|uniref:Uncharacterized protein n=1 Tax=Mesorhabditis belari TaxID=2138241 RepID=A0AAF3J9M9_9BILA
MSTLKLVTFGALLLQLTAAHWIGEEYWTTIDFLGAIKDDRSPADFLELNGPNGARTNGWVAYWITRSKYPGVHYEAFGHAIRRDDGRICGYFVGDEDEVAEVCGGFRVLSRNRNNRAERAPFEWVLAREVRDQNDAVGFTVHRVASTQNGQQIIYGDAVLTQRHYKGVEPGRFEEPISKIGSDEFSTRVYLLRKTTPESGPDRTGFYQNGPYHDPHTKHAHGWAGHPAARDQHREQPQRDQPRPEEQHRPRLVNRHPPAARGSPQDLICHRVVTADGREFKSCHRPQAPSNTQVDPHDKRLQDPRSNPSYSYYDPIFDPRSPLYDPQYNPYDPQYNPEKDREWRQAQGFGEDGSRRTPAPRRSDEPRPEPRRPQEELDRQPPARPNANTVPVRVFRPGPVIPPRNDATNGSPPQILSPGESGATVVDDKGRLYRKKINSNGRETYVLDDSERSLHLPGAPRRPQPPAPGSDNEIPIGHGALPAGQEPVSQKIGEGAVPKIPPKHEEISTIGDGAQVERNDETPKIGQGAQQKVNISDVQEEPKIGGGVEVDGGNAQIGEGARPNEEGIQLPTDRDPDQDYVDKVWGPRSNLPTPPKSSELNDNE